MVSSITPGASGAAVVGLDLRFARQQNPAPNEADRRLDRVEISSATLAVARDSVRAGLEHANFALAIGHEAQAMLVGVQGIARAGGEQSDLDRLLSAFVQRVDAALARGAAMIAGESLLVEAEPGGPPVELKGVDLRLKSAPGEEDLIAVARAARADDPALAQAAQRSLDALQAAMGELVQNLQALEAHQGFLKAAESALGGIRRDLDAEGARLLALQVRQGLQALGGESIANAEPAAVLNLFRADA
jgi:hypothetical protein